MSYEDVYKSLKIKNKIYVGDHIEVTKIKNLKSQITMVLTGTFAEFSFPFNAITLTEQAIGYAKVYDLSAAAYQPLATSGTGGGYTANYQIFPDADAIGDYAIFGAAAPFGAMYFDMSATVATYAADSVTWQYWNGTAWDTLTILWDDTNTTPAAGGERPFMQDGYIIFSAPTDWAATTIDGQSAYWVRAYVAAASVTQIPLTDSKEHQLPSSLTATEVPAKGTIGRGRISFVTVSGSTDNSDIILHNLTSGASSAIKVLTKALVNNEVADFALVVNAGDAIAIYGTDEDGTTEFADGIAELDLVRSE